MSHEWYTCEAESVTVYEQCGFVPPPHRLGLAYAGSCRMEIVECLLPVLQDSKSTPEVSSTAITELLQPKHY